MSELRPVPDFDLLISASGDVFNRKTLRQYRPVKCRLGYMSITIKRISTGIRTKQSIHRLVAMAFIPNPENKPCVNHRDGVKNNNHVSNLEWCSHKENIQHAWDNGLFKERTMDHIIWKRYKCIETCYKTGEYTHGELADIFGVTQPMITIALKKLREAA